MRSVCNVAWAIQVEKIVNDAPDEDRAIARVERFDEDLALPPDVRPRGRFDARGLMKMMELANKTGGRL